MKNRFAGLRFQVIAVVVGDAINFSAGIVTAMILARVIPVEVMGTYRQIMYLGPMSVTIAEFGLSNTVYRYWNVLNEQSRSIYVKMVLMMTIFFSIIASLMLALLSAPLATAYKNPSLEQALLVSSLFPLASIPLMLLRPVLICRGYAWWGTLLETGFSIISVMALIIPLLLGKSFIMSLAIWMVVMLSRMAVIPFILKHELFSHGKYWDRQILNQIWEYEFPIQMGRFPGYITGYFDKVVMSLFLTTREFAVYSIGARELPFIGNIGASVSNVLVPNLVDDVQAGRFEQIQRRWRLACERTAMATYLVATFSIWYAVPMIQLFFSAQYTESSVPFRVFSSLTFLRVIEYASLAKAYGRGDLIMKSSFISAGTLIFVSIPLTYTFQSLGMALSFLIGTLAAVIYFLANYRRLLDVPISSFFPWQRLLLIAFFSLVSVAFVSFALDSSLSLSADLAIITLAWKLVILFILAGCIYLALLFVSGMLGLKSK